MLMSRPMQSVTHCFAQQASVIWVQYLEQVTRLGPMLPE
jgi:hypothetical protein